MTQHTLTLDEKELAGLKQAIAIVERLTGCRMLDLSPAEAEAIHAAFGALESPPVGLKPIQNSGSTPPPPTTAAN